MRFWLWAATIGLLSLGFAVAGASAEPIQIGRLDNQPKTIVSIKGLVKRFSADDKLLLGRMAAFLSRRTASLRQSGRIVNFWEDKPAPLFVQAGSRLTFLTSRQGYAEADLVSLPQFAPFLGRLVDFEIRPVSESGNYTGFLFIARALGEVYLYVERSRKEGKQFFVCCESNLPVQKIADFLKGTSIKPLSRS